MSTRARAAARVLIVSLLVTAAVAGIGLLIGVLRDEAIRDSVAYTLWIAGAIVLLLVGLGGSPSRNLVEGRSELGGRMIGRPRAQTPLGYALTGLVLVATGVLVYVLG